MPEFCLVYSDTDMILTVFVDAMCLRYPLYWVVFISVSKNKKPKPIDKLTNVSEMLPYISIQLVAF